MGSQGRKGVTKEMAEQYSSQASKAVPGAARAPADDQEFSMLAEAAAEAGLETSDDWPVRRIFFELEAATVGAATPRLSAPREATPGEAMPAETTLPRQLSAIVWGDAPPEVVMFHGGAQNAHTWDTTLMALNRPALAVDLPGHGCSDWRADHSYSPLQLAQDVQHIVAELAPEAACVAGMSLGGLTALMLADLQPQLVRRLMLIDITPGVNRAKAEPILEFIGGQQVFQSFEEILDYTIQHNPTRSHASLRRGVLNNAKELPDGNWTWRWDPTRIGEQASPEIAFASAWDALDTLSVPLWLLKGSESGVVADEDVAELLTRRPDAEVIVVPGAGHSIQGDKPVELAALLEAFISV